VRADPCDKLQPLSAHLPHTMQAKAPPFSHLVLDTNAMITGATLPGLAERYFTVEQVLAEVRDVRARAVLDTLPFKLETRLPAESSIEAVKAFAKLTGDLTKLSTVDILVLALTHQLEKEVNGTTFIRTEPPKVVTKAALPHGGSAAPHRPAVAATAVTGAPAEASGAGVGAAAPTPVCRFYRSKAGCRNGEACRFLHPSHAPVDTVAELSSVAVWSAVEGSGAEAAVAAAGDATAARSGPVLSAPTTASTEASGGKASTVAGACSDAAAHGPAGCGGGTDHSEGEDDSDGFDDDDDGAGLWIGPGMDGPAPLPAATATATAGKLAPVASSALPFGYEIVHGASFAPSGSEGGEGARRLVGCITSDFAMQNVLLQMGLNLASVGGKVVRSVRSWVLKCDACFTITDDMSRLFCKACGNATLSRLGVTLGPDGAPRYHYKKNRTVSTRGTVYSLPAPKGGRDGATGDLLLREDQLLTGAWAVRVRTSKGAGEREGLFSHRLNTLSGVNPDSLAAGMSGKGVKGAGRVGTGVGVAGTDIVVGFGKRNPNERRRRR